MSVRWLGQRDANFSLVMCQLPPNKSLEATATGIAA